MDEYAPDPVGVSDPRTHRLLGCLTPPSNPSSSRRLATTSVAVERPAPVRRRLGAHASDRALLRPLFAVGPAAVIVLRSLAPSRTSSSASASSVSGLHSVFSPVRWSRACGQADPIPRRRRSATKSRSLWARPAADTSRAGPFSVVEVTPHRGLGRLPPPARRSPPPRPDHLPLPRARVVHLHLVDHPVLGRTVPRGMRSPVSAFIVATSWALEASRYAVTTCCGVASVSRYGHVPDRFGVPPIPAPVRRSPGPRRGHQPCATHRRHAPRPVR